MTERERFELWIQRCRVWTKYKGTAKAVSLRMDVTQTNYLDFRVNDRWQAWNAALKFNPEYARQVI